MITFDNTYAQLPPDFFQEIKSPNDFKPTLIAYNHELAKELGIDLDTDPTKLAKYFSATEFLPGSKPIAMAYAGHQFGHFSPQLGDGRAMLLGEFIAKDNKRYDIHLKGSGRTFFSRRGDGKSAIGPVIREYLVSEGMHALHIPTTRTLCAIRTGEMVHREDLLPGAVQTRIGLSHIRVGTFEFFARRGEGENVKTLADYTIQRLYPGLSYYDFWKTVAQKQVELIVSWMSVGFIHGVMNTDNMAISCETIDFGPCAFMDHFNFNKVFSSIDQQGRYAFSNQPQIALWNLARLAECLLPLMNKTPEEFNHEFGILHQHFVKKYIEAMTAKLGISESQEDDMELINTWFEFLQNNNLDFTLSFIDLERILEGKPTFTEIKTRPGFEEFSKLWKKRVTNNETAIALMKKHNPLTIPRNHQVEKVIQASQNGDDSEFFKLLKVIQNPFERMDALTSYQMPPKADEVVHQTFCGT